VCISVLFFKKIFFDKLAFRLPVLLTKEERFQNWESNVGLHGRRKHLNKRSNEHTF
jgi:hypothetical protein